MNKEKLKLKYGIKEVQGGQFGEGFFSCLDSIDKGIIINTEERNKLEKISHTLVLWNAKKLSEHEAFESIKKIADKEFKYSWSIYCKGIKEWAKLVKFVR